MELQQGGGPSRPGAELAHHLDFRFLLAAITRPALALPAMAQRSIISPAPAPRHIGAGSAASLLVALDFPSPHTRGPMAPARRDAHRRPGLALEEALDPGSGGPPPIPLPSGEALLAPARGEVPSPSSARDDPLPVYHHVAGVDASARLPARARLVEPALVPAAISSPVFPARRVVLVRLGIAEQACTSPERGPPGRPRRCAVSDRPTERGIHSSSSSGRALAAPPTGQLTTVTCRARLWRPRGPGRGRSGFDHRV